MFKNVRYKIQNIIFENLIKESKSVSYFLRWTDDPNSDIKRNFSGHLQAWHENEEDAMRDYNERISNGHHVPYPPRKDVTTGMWNSEPEWGLSGYHFKDEKSFHQAMSEINDIAWYHKESRQQDLVVFKSSNYILGDGFDGEDVFRDAEKFWYIESDMDYHQVMKIISS